MEGAVASPRADGAHPVRFCEWDRWRLVVRDGKLLVRIQVQPSVNGPVYVRNRTGESMAYLREGSSNRPASRRSARALGNTRRLRLVSIEQALLTYLAGSEPKSVRDIAKHLKMGERRTQRVLVPLLEAGYVHDRLGRRIALTARGAQRIQNR